MPEKIYKKFESRHLAGIQKNQKAIRAVYKKTINKIFKGLPPINLKSGTFKISDYPALNKKITDVLVDFTQEVNVTLLNGINEQWELSTEKNAEVIHKHYKGKKLAKDVERMIYDPQGAALDEFTKRKIAGLDLSDRVLKYTSQLQGQIEQNLYAGISEGRSAAAMAQDQVKYMENPEPLFRRVRDAEGKLQLSSAAKKYYKELGAPGQGVYRSPYKNFMRITRTTINDSYREADMVRYQSLPFIIGYQVNLSNNHPRTDICDDLKGIYPKTFTWRRWHPQCMCNCTAKLASPEDYDKYEQALLNGTADKFEFKDVVNDTPPNFKAYVDKKQGSMDNWKRKPDWVTENGIKI